MSILNVGDKIRFTRDIYSVSKGVKTLLVNSGDFAMVVRATVTPEGVKCDLELFTHDTPLVDVPRDWFELLENL